MKKLAKLLSVLLVAVFLMSFGVTAFANEGGSETISIFKTVHIADPSASKPVETFTFNFEPVGVEEKTPAGQSLAAEIQLKPLTIEFNGEEAYQYVSGTTDCAATKFLQILDLSSFSCDLSKFMPGDDLYFEWIVSEQKGSTDGMTYDSTKYIMVAKAKVEGSESSKELGTPVFYFYGEDGVEKFENMQFNNSYEKNTTLEVSNAVKDSGGNNIPDKAFAYTMRVDKPSLSEETVLIYFILDEDGNILPAQSGSALYGEAFSFTLNDGYKVQIAVPEGSTFDILEAGEKNFKPSVTYNEEGKTEKISVKRDYDESLAIPDFETTSKTSIRVANKGTTVDFVNVKREVSPTGIVINNLPFVIMIVIACAGTALVVVSKNRRQNED